MLDLLFNLIIWYSICHLKTDQKGKTMKKKKPSRKPAKSTKPVTLTAEDLKLLKLKAVHRRETLNPAQEMVIKEIHRIVGEHLIGQYEKFELGFCYETNPDRELAIWFKIAVSLILWRQVHQGYTLEQEKKVCGQLLVISTGVKGDKELTQMYLDSEDEVIRRVKVLEEASE